MAGTNSSPSVGARVLDDLTTQKWQFEYNDFGRITRAIDPMGRETTNSYSADLLDLLEVRQKVGTNFQTLAKMTYNSQHLPLTVVDAGGQTNRFGYNANGQLTAITNALNEVVTMAYDANGYLTNITGAISGATTDFTYDGYGRVYTVTDAEGYTLTYNYDALDRPTKVIYPDGTYEEMVYDKLDP